ncbi:MAG: glycosyltransferase [Phycisphaerales bacterium]|nr:MAG: glycosyltransferase [Phycisphaerales bacterium]
MFITAYIPCYNGRTHLRRVLEALVAQSRIPDEIIVVDDGSTDGSAAIATEMGVGLISHMQNRGIAAARNTALKAARGDLLAGLDVDAIPAPDYLERVEAAFRRNPKSDAVCGQLIEAHSVLLPDRWRQVHMAQHHGPDWMENPRICYGSVTTVRRFALEELGGWDERYRTNHEDVDLTQRMYEEGMRAAYEPSCIARHQRRDTIESVLSGFWQWFAPRGQDLGQFDSIESLIGDRIKPVIWGIFEHRFGKDRREARPHLLGPTFLLPWWMALHDLAQLEGTAATADALIQRMQSIVGLMGGSDYVIRRATEALTGLHNCLFAERKEESSSPHATYLAAFERTARRALPTEKLRWSQIEFSLRRWDLEQRLAETSTGPMRTLLANPPWYTAERQGVRAGSRWPFTMDRRDEKPIPRYVPFPFFLAQAAEVLNGKGKPNAIVDAIAEGLSYSEFHERAVGFEPHIMVMETSAASYDNDRRVWTRLKDVLPRARFVLAGPHATARRREILQSEPHIDAVLTGEYEATLARLVELWESGGDLRSLPGLTFRDGESIVDTGRPQPVPFDEVGTADRLRLPLYNYRDRFGTLREPIAQLMSTRGCPYECTFCQWPQVFYEPRKIQRRSVERVFDEVRDLVTRYGFQTVYFDDDMFSPGGAWIEHFADLIRRNRLDFDWSIMSRADTFRPEQWALMAEAGLVAVKFGVESGDQGMVEAMGKRLSLDRVRETVRVCRELGISVHLTFTVGLPGESRQTLARTRELILELLPDSLQISRAMPLPGTTLEDWAVEHGAMKTREASALDGFLLSVLQYPGLSGEEADRFIEQTYAEYRAALAEAQAARSAGDAENIDQMETVAS